MKKIKSERRKLKVKRTFLTKGSCGNTYFYIINREFGHPKLAEETALEPMAGGILQNGYQCGMLWGASMGICTEIYRRHGYSDKSLSLAVKATQHIMTSFHKRTNSIACSEITETDFKAKWGLANYFLKGKMINCYSLAGKWAPEALDAAEESLTFEPENTSQPVLNCASQVIKQMGGSDEEATMVAGFSGGMGLSGDACGALAAAIWKTILDLIKKDEWKSTLNDPDSNKILQSFYNASDYKIECSDICGKKFNSIDEHSEYLKQGGCKELIKALTENYDCN